jgi:hypothetical protein
VPLLQQSLLSQHSQPLGQYPRGDADAFSELIKARQTAMGIPQYPQTPSIASKSQAAGYGARVIVNGYVANSH